MVPISLPGPVLAAPGGPSARPRASLGAPWAYLGVHFPMFCLDICASFFPVFFGILFLGLCALLEPILLPFWDRFCVIFTTRAWMSRPQENAVPADQIKGPGVWKT